jgi:uncharacterized protein
VNVQLRVRSRLVAWAAAALATFASGRALLELGMPSPYLFSALVVGIAVALAYPRALKVRREAFLPAQAITGVTIGAYLQSSSLSELAGSWLAIVLVCAGTLALGLAAGVFVTRRTSLDAPTGTLGMVPGGAVGIVSLADDLGADSHMVAFMQYLRVLVVVLLMPLLVATLFHAGTNGGATAGGAPVLGGAEGWAITVGIAVAGALIAQVARVTAATLMGPMILSAAITLAGADFAVPRLLQETAFALIGLQVGLRFTLGSLRQAGAVLVPVLAAILGLMAASFGLAVALDAATSASLLDCYLATTPGGLYAVLAAGIGAGADSTFILAVQGLRLLVMVLLAPLAVRALVRRLA